MITKTNDNINYIDEIIKNNLNKIINFNNTYENTLKLRMCLIGIYHIINNNDIKNFFNDNDIKLIKEKYNEIEFFDDNKNIIENFINNYENKNYNIKQDSVIVNNNKKSIVNNKSVINNENNENNINVDSENNINVDSENNINVDSEYNKDIEYNEDSEDSEYNEKIKNNGINESDSNEEINNDNNDKVNYYKSENDNENESENEFIEEKNNNNKNNGINGSDSNEEINNENNDVLESLNDKFKINNPLLNINVDNFENENMVDSIPVVINKPKSLGVNNKNIPKSGGNPPNEKSYNLLSLALLKNPFNKQLINENYNYDKLMYSWEEENLILYKIDNKNNKTKLLENINNFNCNNNDVEECEIYKTHCTFENNKTIDKDFVQNVCRTYFNENFTLDSFLSKEKILYYYRLLINLGFEESFNKKTLSFDLNKDNNKKILNNETIINKDNKEKLKIIILNVNKALAEVFNTDKVIKYEELLSNIPQRLPSNNKINFKKLLNINQYGGVDNDNIYNKNLNFIKIFKNFLNKNGKTLGEKTEKIYHNLNNIIQDFSYNIQNTKNLLNYNNILLSYTAPQDIFLDEKLTRLLKNSIDENENELNNIIKQQNELKNDLIINFKIGNPNLISPLIQLLQRFM